MIPSAAPSTLTDLDQPFFAFLVPRSWSAPGER
jgi:hypothetical protein